MMRSRVSSPVVSVTSGFQMHNVDVSSTKIRETFGFFHVMTRVE